MDAQLTFCALQIIYSKTNERTFFSIGICNSNLMITYILLLFENYLLLRLYRRMEFHIYISFFFILNKQIQSLDIFFVFDNRVREILHACENENESEWMKNMLAQPNIMLYMHIYIDILNTVHIVISILDIFFFVE